MTNPTEKVIINPTEKLRERIAQSMYYQHVTSGFKWENESQWFRDKYLNYADQILQACKEAG